VAPEFRVEQFHRGLLHDLIFEGGDRDRPLSSESERSSGTCIPHLAWLTQLYELYMKPVIPNGEWGLIRSAVTRGQLTGGEHFVEEIRQITGQRIEQRGRGEPLKPRK